MREYLELGSTPSDENCAQTVDENYYDKVRKECNLYIKAIRNKLGKEPEGARLNIKSFPHDSGSYYEVVCKYDIDNEVAMEYAFKCESESPITWEEGGITQDELAEIN